MTVTTETTPATTGLKEPATDFRAGTWLDGYQAVSPAPIDLIKGDRHRYIDGKLVKGAWSDPWWMYDPARGWAIARRWRNKEQRVFSSEPGNPFKLVGFPARQEREVTPWTPIESN